MIPGVGVLAHQKNNLAPAPPTLGFRIEDATVLDGQSQAVSTARLHWLADAVAGITADDVLASPAAADEAVPDAVAVLRELLAEGPCPADQGLAEGQKLGAE